MSKKKAILFIEEYHTIDQIADKILEQALKNVDIKKEISKRYDSYNTDIPLEDIIEKLEIAFYNALKNILTDNINFRLSDKPKETGIAGGNGCTNGDWVLKDKEIIEMLEKSESLIYNKKNFNYGDFATIEEFSKISEQHGTTKEVEENLKRLSEVLKKDTIK